MKGGWIDRMGRADRSYLLGQKDTGRTGGNAEETRASLAGRDVGHLSGTGGREWCTAGAAQEYGKWRCSSEYSRITVVLVAVRE